MGAADSTETNAILASGLAIVGLLGVAGAFLPPDMLPGTERAASQTVGEVSGESRTEPSQRKKPEEPTPTPAAEKTAVFKPVELESISDGDPEPGEGKTIMEGQSLEAVDVMEVAPEPVKAAEQVLETTTEPVGVEPKGTAGKNTSDVPDTSRQTVETPVQEGAAPSAANQPAVTGVAPVMPRASTPVWNNWQNPGYQPPQFQQPRFAPSPYPPQPYGYPQWGAYPQR